MASSSGPFVHPDSGLKKKASTTPLRTARQAAFWSPLLLLTGMVHVLCRPITRRILLAVAVINIPLQCGVHLFYRTDSAQYGAIAGLHISITTAALFGLYLGWLFSELAANRTPRIIWNRPIIAYTVVVFFSLFVASDIQLSLFQLYFVIELLLLYFYLAGNINSRDDVVFVLFMLLIGGLLESSYMLVLALIGNKLGLSPTPDSQAAVMHFLGTKTVIFLPAVDVPFTRQGGTIGSPNYAAAYLGIIITLAICIRQMPVPKYLRRITIPMIVLGVVALASTFSRGGWIEIVLSVAILTMAKWMRSGISGKGIAIAVVVVALVVLGLAIPNAISERLLAGDNGSAYSRVPLMHLADQIISANPVLGVGANNFTAVMNDYMVPELRNGFLYTVHNEYLLVWAETGVIGLMAYLWIYFNLISRSWRLWKTGDKLFAPLGLAIVASICGFMSHMLVDIFSDGGIIQLLMVLIALVSVAEILSRNKFAGTASHTIEATR